MAGCILILGGDSFLGRAIERFLTSEGYRVISTTRRKNSNKPGSIYLDFADIPDDWKPPVPVHAAIVCAASTSREVCENNPAEAYRINVTAPEMLAHGLLGMGIFMVLLSTNLVLGGSKPFLETSAAYSPIDVYSSQKAEAEKRLLALEGSGTGISVLRLTKVLDPQGAMIQSWLNHGREGRPVEVFDDVLIAPLSAGHVGQAVLALIEKRGAGIFHLSGNREIGYAEMARLALQARGLSGELVVGIKGRTLNPIARLLPPHASLGMNQLAALSGLGPPSPEEVADCLARDISNQPKRS